MSGHANVKVFVDDAEIEKDDTTLKSLELGDKTMEVEVIYKVNIEVQGKGKGYSMTVEVQPTEELDVLR